MTARQFTARTTNTIAPPTACFATLLAALSAGGCANQTMATAPVADTSEHVVLLHGLARTSRSMEKMQRALANEGYGTCNVGYPSTRFPIATLLHEHVLPAMETCLGSGDAPVNFVTHSMGGIIVRLLLDDDRAFNVGRVVMLSPPNQGSEVVDSLGGNWFFKALNGPAGNELGTGSDSVPNSIGPAHYPVGIITGNRSINLILSSIIPGPDDGKVSVERARLEGMTDFLVVPKSHPFIMRDDDVIGQAIHFLEHEGFLQPQ